MDWNYNQVLIQNTYLILRPINELTSQNYYGFGLNNN